MNDNKESCETCHYWHCKLKTTTFQVGDCRRRSPVLTNFSDTKGRWPTTRDNIWCGDYERKSDTVEAKETVGIVPVEKNSPGPDDYVLPKFQKVNDMWGSDLEEERELLEKRLAEVEEELLQQG